ncbi:hypothetical protein O1L60_42585 [Streptomyces diastatochromogenes]|nr:hypothetical protein [Streptomyces diastatochromogenes]
MGGTVGRRRVVLTTAVLVARAHNEMLHRLPELLCGKRDFTASISHKPHMPLAGPQLTLEAGLTQDDYAPPST